MLRIDDFSLLYCTSSVIDRFNLLGQRRLSTYNTEMAGQALLLVFGLLFTVQVALGQVTVQCRNTTLNPTQNFDIERYTGKEWYTILYVPGARINSTNTGKCESESFASTEVRGTYRVNADGVNKTSNSNISISLLVNVDRNNSAVMQVQREQTTSLLLGTDYNTWSIWYGCAVDGNSTREWTVIRSRARTIDPSIYDVLKSWTVQLGFNLENSHEEEQTGC